MNSVAKHSYSGLIQRNAIENLKVKAYSLKLVTRQNGILHFFTSDRRWATPHTSYICRRDQDCLFPHVSCNKLTYQSIKRSSNRRRRMRSRSNSAKIMSQPTAMSRRRYEPQLAFGHVKLTSLFRDVLRSNNLNFPKKTSCKKR